MPLTVNQQAPLDAEKRCQHPEHAQRQQPTPLRGKLTAKETESARNPCAEHAAARSAPSVAAKVGWRALGARTTLETGWRLEVTLRRLVSCRVCVATGSCAFVARASAQSVVI